MHRSAKVRNFQLQNRIEHTGHPAYSPDLAPNDFWLIRELKKKLRGKKFENEIDLYNDVLKCMSEIPKDEFKKCFDYWLQKMRRCVEANGAYFEWRKRGERRSGEGQAE